ncbi:MAG: hypothetical protein QXN63_05165 [Candidatus Bathyarchaeia archaeon]
MVSYEEIAKYAFMAFAIISIVAGLAIGYMAWDSNNKYPYGFTNPTDAVADANGTIMLIMLILGVIAGLISVTAKEVTAFLIAAIALLVVDKDIFAPLARLHDLLAYWSWGIVSYIIAFAAPAAIIIAIKSVWAIAKEK